MPHPVDKAFVSTTGITKYAGVRVHVLDHPLAQHKLTLLRDVNTSVKEFRELTGELAVMLTYEATRGLPLEPVEVETPLTRCTVSMIRGKKPIIVSILRAGNGMLNGVQTLLPNARVGYVGYERDERTAVARRYYHKPGNVQDRLILVVDPMLATAGTAIQTVTDLKEDGATNIKFLCLVTAPEGIEAFTKVHPDVSIHCVTVDSHLNDRKYIVPGLGDAGDRLTGTTPA